MRTTLALLLTGAASLLATSGDLGAQTDSRPPATCENTSEGWREGAGYQQGDGVISYGGFLWVCKGGAATALCDDRGYEPDRDGQRATAAWERIDQCLFVSNPEVRTESVVVSNITCKGTIGVVTLTATLFNESPFDGDIRVAFYHSANKTLIASEPVFIPAGFDEPVQVSTTWRASSVGAALITVAADDDGTGRSERFENNEDDNLKQVKLTTCPIPKPGPLQP
jgi:hypothetical protein